MSATETPIKPDPATAPVHINTQIYERFVALMESGQLRPGDKLPSLRSLSSELGVARGTVEAAYGRLIGDGYFEARGPSGTYVTAAALNKASGPAGAHAGAPAPAPAVAGPAADIPSARIFAEQAVSPFGLLQDTPGMLQMGVPALDAFPRKLWSRLATRQVRAASNLVRPPTLGFLPLRDAIAAYLLRSRGIVCSADQVIVVSGYAAALGMAVRALSLEGRSVWVESPGYIATPPLMRTLGMTPVAVPVDPQGLDVQAGQARCPDAGLAVVTPSHQSPLGVALSLERRHALLQWAGHADAWIVEDDYDSEFRYTGPPLPALKSLDREDRVIYSGTFSKVLFPGLRLGYMVVPRSRLNDFTDACSFGLWGVCPELLQAVVCDFMIGGDFARHIKRMRALYAKRRAFLVDALRARVPAGMTVHLTQGGMHLLISVPPGVSDVDWARRARIAGFAVQPLSLWSAEPGGGQGLIMGFTNVESAGQAREQVEALMTAVGR